MVPDKGTRQGFEATSRVRGTVGDNNSERHCHGPFPPASESVSPGIEVTIRPRWRGVAGNPGPRADPGAAPPAAGATRKPYAADVLGRHAEPDAVPADGR